MHIAVVALGPSADTYYRMAEGSGGRRSFCDETWGINSNGDVLACDRVFHMDDVRIQEARANGGNVKIGAMLKWMRTAPGPIYTSRSHPSYPGLVDYPLEDVINACGTDYFNSTAAYAVAYGLYLHAQKPEGKWRFSLFGMDYTWPDRHEAEKGRACVEYWVGRAMQRGIEIFVPKTSTLIDANVPKGERLYGYDTLDVAVGYADGKAKVTMEPRDEVPSGAAMEARYSHDARKLTDV